MPIKEIGRRIVRQYLADRMRATSAPLQIPNGESVLVLAPHPDDEAFGCGALLARLSSGGAQVSVAYLTHGEGSHRGHPTLSPADMGRRRTLEAQAAMQVAGIGPEHLRFLGAPDGRLASLTDAERKAWSASIASVLRETAPGLVLAPSRQDGSSEHEAAFGLLVSALAQSGRPRPRLLEFPVWSWWSPRHLARAASSPQAVWRQASGSYIEAKRRMFLCYPSQTEPVPPWRDPALPRGFAEAFDQPEEFFFESAP